MNEQLAESQRFLDGARVAAALTREKIGAGASHAISAMLDKVAARVGSGRIDEAESLLVDKAPGLSADQLARLIGRAEAWLDPDGIAAREYEQRAARQLHAHED